MPNASTTAIERVAQLNIALGYWNYFCRETIWKKRRRRIISYHLITPQPNMSLRPIIISLTTGRTSLSSLRLGSLPSKAMQSRTLGSLAATAQHRFGTLTKANITKYQRPNLAARSMASSSSNSGEKKASENVNADSEEATSNEIVLTPGEKVVVGSRLFFWSGILAFASVCAYYIGQ